MKKQKQLTITEQLENAFSVMSGKLKGFLSLSTSPALNERCQKKAKCGKLICHFCYAISLVKMRSGLGKKLVRNTEMLTREIYPVEAWPLVNALYFRFEAFGDLNNTIQFNNYVNFAKRNPKTTFALWTKNPDIIALAIRFGTVIPDNMIIIYSSPLLNHEAQHIKKAYPFIDKVFTVYDKKTIKEKGIEINCGGRHCLSCLKCYEKHNGIDRLQEQKK